MSQIDRAFIWIGASFFALVVVLFVSWVTVELVHYSYHKFKHGAGCEHVRSVHERDRIARREHEVRMMTWRSNK